MTASRTAVTELLDIARGYLTDDQLTDMLGSMEGKMLSIGASKSVSQTMIALRAAHTQRRVLGKKPLILRAHPHCCEEASSTIGFYAPCNRPATKMVGWEHRSEGPYRMCDECADHNVRNRGAVVLGPYEQPDAHGWYPLRIAPLETLGSLYTPELPDRTDITGEVHERADKSRFAVSGSTRGYEFTHWRPSPLPPVCAPELVGRSRAGVRVRVRR